MGRHCDELEDMKDSGVLSTAILSVIGEDRYQNSWFNLNYEEVQSTLFNMGEALDTMQAIKNGALSYQDVNTKAIGYRKMEVIMGWWYTTIVKIYLYLLRRLYD